MYNNPLLFFDVSGGELLVILMAVFLLFGPKRIPEIARSIGKGIYELKKATEDIKSEIQEKSDEITNEVKTTISDKEDEN
jgi:sec-independent protein translocase protein TatA